MAINFNDLPTITAVQEALALGEGQQIEFKGSVPDAATLGKHVSAFANTAGGWIIVGVKEAANCGNHRL